MKKISIHFGETFLKCIVYVIIAKSIRNYLPFEDVLIDISIMSSTIVLIQGDMIKFFNNQIDTKRVVLIFIISFICYITGMYLLNYDIDTAVFIQALICAISMLILELLAKRVKKGNVE